MDKIIHCTTINNAINILQNGMNGTSSYNLFSDQPPRIYFYYGSTDKAELIRLSNGLHMSGYVAFLQIDREALNGRIYKDHATNSTDRAYFCEQSFINREYIHLAYVAWIGHKCRFEYPSKEPVDPIEFLLNINIKDKSVSEASTLLERLEAHRELFTDNEVYGLKNTIKDIESFRHEHPELAKMFNWNLGSSVSL